MNHGNFHPDSSVINCPRSKPATSHAFSKGKIYIYVNPTYLLQYYTLTKVHIQPVQNHGNFHPNCDIDGHFAMANNFFWKTNSQKHILTIYDLINISCQANNSDLAWLSSCVWQDIQPALNISCPSTESNGPNRPTEADENKIRSFIPLPDTS